MKRDIRKKLVFWMAVVFFVASAASALFYFMIRLQLFGSVPSSVELKSLESYNASLILARGGEQLGKYFLYDRTSIAFNEVPANVTDALIATEDVRFYNHRGIDPRSMVRVAVKNLLMGQKGAGGGSTITLQLAKNLYPRKGGNKMNLLVDKIRESIIARRLERIYSKEEILIHYLNTVSFGDNVFGISAASNRFFNKSPLQLKLEEAALLVGMLKATHNYNPRLYPERSLFRRNTVIGQMRKYNYISEQMADSLMNLPIVLDYAPVSHIYGPAPYFREKLRQELVMWLEGYNARNGTEYNLYTDGLIIHTSLDYDLQIMAEEAMGSRLLLLQNEVDRHYQQASKARAADFLNQLMKRSKRYEEWHKQGLSESEIKKAFAEKRDLVTFDGSEETLVNMSLMDSIFNAQKLLHAAIFSMEPETGYVRAWVGGLNYRFIQFDNVLSHRQTGSSFKPFVYAAALETGTNPCDYISNQPIVYNEFEGWSPVNANRNYEGFFSMKGALSNSVNTVSVRILQNTGYEPIINILGKAGLSYDVPRVPSLALGTIEMSLFDLTTAYGIFANQGVAVTPVYLLRIEDADGNILFEWIPQEPLQPAISERNALLIKEMLKSATQTGTARGLGADFAGITDIAGKTGTTQHNSDGWFVGFTPGLISGVWVGLENPAFASLFPLPFGASHSAVALWGDYIKQACLLESTQKQVSGRFASLPQDLREVLDCPDFIQEMPRVSWFEKLFGKPDEPKPQQADSLDKTPRKRGLFRRILDEIF